MINDELATPTEKKERPKAPTWVLPLVLLTVSVIAFWVVPSQRPPAPATITFDRSKAPVTPPVPPNSEDTVRNASSAR